MDQIIYNLMHRMRGWCSTGCGCESIKEFHPNETPVNGLDVTFCRRCNAYTLFEWRYDE